MIELTRLNNEKIVVNADLIEFLERTPDTIVTTSTGKKLMVKETIDEVIDKVIAYHQRSRAIMRKDA
jgi:flagellar protein FlbD